VGNEGDQQLIIRQIECARVTTGEVRHNSPPAATLFFTREATIRFRCFWSIAKPCDTEVVREPCADDSGPSFFSRLAQITTRWICDVPHK